MAEKTCFVIQRFDNGIYDRRFRETFGPAIERGGARPVRADEVLGTRPVVEKIEQGLRSADVAFAEISEDNPNVFLELGYALSLGVPTIIVCDRAQRESLPFDIAHRPVNFYSTSVQSDYERIAKQVERGIAAALLEENSPAEFNNSVATEADMDDVKAACLAALLDQSLRSPVGSALWKSKRRYLTRISAGECSLFQSPLCSRVALWSSICRKTARASGFLFRYQRRVNLIS